jgi:beta-lactamase superfamily II metal-dependent hydrolase
MDTLRVRMYNVRFGDAILITVPDTECGVPKTRHILIDVGNALSKEGGQDFVFKPVIEDIRATIGDAPVDLYVMTHEHLDHIQGLLYGEVKEGLPRLPVESAWLPASSEPGYYDRNWPETDADGNPIATPKKHLDTLEANYWAIARYAEARKNAGEPLPAKMQALLLNNNPRDSAQCVDYLRSLPQQPSCYIHRESGNGDPSALHPFEVAQLQIWAPEENTAIYYGQFRPMTLGVEGGAEGGVEGADNLHMVVPKPPQGVDAGAFYRLVEARRNGLVDNILAIDQAKNNSGIVFSLEWQGWKLLFTGDAEERSWREMNKRGVLSAVHFLKISHHASHNGTPEDEILDKILPLIPHDERERVAVASTFPDTYAGIPDGFTQERLESRGVITYIVYEELEDGLAADAGTPGHPVLGYLEFTFPADGTTIQVNKHTLSPT